MNSLEITKHIERFKNFDAINVFIHNRNIIVDSFKFDDDSYYLVYHHLTLLNPDVQPTPLKFVRRFESFNEIDEFVKLNCAVVDSFKTDEHYYYLLYHIHPSAPKLNLALVHIANSF